MRLTTRVAVGVQRRLVRVRVVFLRAAGLDGTHVAVAARPEAGRRRQIQRLHRLRLHVAVTRRAQTALIHLEG